jgi:hypothetical protein
MNKKTYRDTETMVENMNRMNKEKNAREMAWLEKHKQAHSERMLLLTGIIFVMISIGIVALIGYMWSVTAPFYEISIYHKSIYHNGTTFFGFFGSIETNMTYLIITTNSSNYSVAQNISVQAYKSLTPPGYNISINPYAPAGQYAITILSVFLFAFDVGGCYGLYKWLTKENE